jgi:hypothetical protein
MAEQTARHIGLRHDLFAILIRGAPDAEGVKDRRHRREQALLSDVDAWTDPASKAEAKVSRVTDIRTCGPRTRGRAFEIALGHELFRVGVTLGIL